MQIRCTHCTKTIALAANGALLTSCPHCSQPPGPGRLGPYEPLRLLATGGMGEVYLARHQDLGTEVVIKVLPAIALAAAAVTRERFAREARLTAKVQHPGIVKVHAFDVEGDRPYLVLEFVAGQTLRQRLAAGALTMVEAARCVAQTADVHALGVLLYELLTGHSPFHGANLFQALKLVEALVPAKPSSLRADVPAALDAVVLRALAKQANDRFASARAFATALREAVPAACLPSAARPRAPWWSWLSLAAALVLGTVGVLMLQREPLAAVDLDDDAFSLAANILADRVSARTAAEQALTAGHWATALLLAERAVTAGDATMLDLARHAFVLTHLTWPLAANAPPWLGCYDEGQRTRLFGDRLEPATSRDAMLLAQSALLAGDERLAQQHLQTLTDTPTVRRLRLLAAHLGATDLDTLRAQHDALAAADEACAQLLAVRLVEPDRRAEAFVAIAQRLSIEAPEHWLARTLERHARGQTQDATHAAEQAWLLGAGELAVLLDASLMLLPGTVHGVGLRTLPIATMVSMQRRVQAGDGQDAPAGCLVHALGTAGSGGLADLSSVRTFPAPVRQSASRWFVAAAIANPPHNLQLLMVAASLGATPEYSLLPWSLTSPDTRSMLDAEARRGR